MQLWKEIITAEKDRFRMEFENLKDQLKIMQEMQDLYLLDREKLASLYQEGKIYESDKPIIKFNSIQFLRVN